MSLAEKTFPLNTGAKLPGLALGTWLLRPGVVEKAIETALRHGYRHIDTAFAYDNEKGVGEGIRASGVPREEIFITTKLGNSWHKRVPEALNISLENLGVDYLDLYLMHWPCSTDPTNSKKHLPDWDYVKTWEEMQKLLDTGKVRAIGVSNFQISHLERLLNAPTTKIIPAVNQIELHPYHPSPKLVKYCLEKGIHPSGYAPLGAITSPLYNDQTIKEVAKKHHAEVAHVLLAWGIQNGWSVLPKSGNLERLKGNYDGVKRLKLDDEDMKRINSVPERLTSYGDSSLPIRIFFGEDE